MAAVASAPPGLRPAPTAPPRRLAPVALPRRRSWLVRIAWGVWLVAALPLVAFVVAGLMASRLASGAFWWAQLAAVGLPYAAMALAAATVVPLAARRWGWVFTHVVLVGLVAWRALPGDRSAPAPLGSPPDDVLVLTTFNLPEAGPSREALGDSAVAFVRRTAPDLLLLQDAWAYQPVSGPVKDLSVQVAAVQSRLPYVLRLPRNPGPTDKEGVTGVPLLVRRTPGLAVVAQETVPLGSDPDASIAIRSLVRWRGREFVLYNVHLRSFGQQKPWEDSDVRLSEPFTWLPYLQTYRTVYADRGADTERLAERIEAETLPVVVAGDFNSTADNGTTHRLKTAGRPAGAPRVDAFRARGGWAWGRTYRSDRPAVRIDFVLVDPALDVVGADVTDVAFSDHRPVRTHLRWAPDVAADSVAAP